MEKVKKKIEKTEKVQKKIEKSVKNGKMSKVTKNILPLINLDILKFFEKALINKWKTAVDVQVVFDVSKKNKIRFFIYFSF